MKASYKLNDTVKRGIDIVISSIGLVISAPIQAVVYLIVKKNLGTPVLFRQRRPGLNGEIFELTKFRTMLEPTETLVSDADRLTNVGKFLRATSLDELPTLWNVLKGDMSVVGPRPLLESYLEHYSAEQSRRHEVRPGITGLAQVKGRNSISWDERLKLDVEYVDNRSLKLDFEILLGTVRAVFKREGINHSGHATMPKFTDGLTNE